MAGSWSEPMDWGDDIVVHISHLPTGKFLIWGAGDFNNVIPDIKNIMVSGETFTTKLLTMIKTR
jgi:hypothetical protein